jgi:2-C-methyl-D-erythritol 4-phosphate cytidylyltransferase
MTTTAILLAGGTGTRLGAGDNKAYLELGGHPLVAWSLATFERCALIDDVVLVTRHEDHDRAYAAATTVGATKLRTVVTGGATRHESEQAGLDALAPRIVSGAITLVAIHDAARPFVTGDLLERLLTAAASHGGAVPGLPVGTPFLIRGSTLIDTSTLRRMQTPQAFHAAALLDAYRVATAAGFHGVDTADTVEHHGGLEVVVIAGDPHNRKVTYAEDLVEANGRAATWAERPGS